MSLPTWQGAEAVYSRAYLLLEWMAKKGHSRAPIKVRGKTVLQGFVSQDMRDLIDALNRGDEELIKGLLLNYIPKELI